MTKGRKWFCIPVIVLLAGMIGISMLSLMWTDSGIVTGDTVTITEITDDTNTVNDPEKESFSIKKPDITVVENRENELVFTLSAADFIDSYNGYYWESYHARGLAPLQEWYMIQRSYAIHSPYSTRRYRFSSDENAWSVPILTIDTPSDGDTVLEIYLNLDDHSRTDATFAQYKNMCRHTLKVFFPAFSDEKTAAIFQELTRLAYANRYDSDTVFEDSTDIVPCALYHQNGIGLYPYFLHGHYYFCIIPVSDASLHDFAAKGTAVYDIEEAFP